MTDDSDASAADADGAGGDQPRHDRVRTHPTPGPGNSLSGWWRGVRNPLRVALNYAVIWLVRVSPSLAAKRWLLRRLGATVEAGATLGLEATPDVFFPELVTVREDAIVGYDATVLCHEFLQDEYRTGEVVIGERAMVGAGAIILPGVEIGADAQVAANSLVTRDVPPGATVAGVPATEMRSDAIHGEDADGGPAPDGTEAGAPGEAAEDDHGEPASDDAGASVRDENEPAPEDG